MQVNYELSILSFFLFRCLILSVHHGVIMVCCMFVPFGFMDLFQDFLKFPAQNKNILTVGQEQTSKLDEGRLTRNHSLTSLEISQFSVSTLALSLEHQPHK